MRIEIGMRHQLVIVTDPCDVQKYVIILECDIIYNLFLKYLWDHILKLIIYNMYLLMNI